MTQVEITKKIVEIMNLANGNGKSGCVTRTNKPEPISDSLLHLRIMVRYLKFANEALQRENKVLQRQKEELIHMLTKGDQHS